VKGLLWQWRAAGLKPAWQGADKARLIKDLEQLIAAGDAELLSRPNGIREKVRCRRGDPGGALPAGAQRAENRIWVVHNSDCARIIA
jgi:hypothetical protein